MFHGGIKYSTEVSNIPQRGLNIPRRYRIFHRGIKHSTEASNIPRRYQIFHGGG